MLLEIRGGPHGMYSTGFDFMWQAGAANWFVVLCTNPSGSTGQGTAFGNPIDHGRGVPTAAEVEGTTQDAECDPPPPANRSSHQLLGAE